MADSTDDVMIIDPDKENPVRTPSPTKKVTLN